VKESINSWARRRGGEGGVKNTPTNAKHERAVVKKEFSKKRAQSACRETTKGDEGGNKNHPHNRKRPPPPLGRKDHNRIEQHTCKKSRLWGTLQSSIREQEEPIVS